MNCGGLPKDEVMISKPTQFKAAAVSGSWSETGSGSGVLQVLVSGLPVFPTQNLKGPHTMATIWSGIFPLKQIRQSLLWGWGGMLERHSPSKQTLLSDKTISQEVLYQLVANEDLAIPEGKASNEDCDGK